MILVLIVKCIVAFNNFWKSRISQIIPNIGILPNFTRINFPDSYSLSHLIPKNWKIFTYFFKIWDCVGKNHI